MKDQKLKITEDNTCPKCGKAFHCSTSARCWCYAYDVPPDTMEWIQDHYQGCLCPDCLKEYAR